MTDLIIDKGGIVSDVWDSRTTKAPSPHGIQWLHSIEEKTIFWCNFESLQSVKVQIGIQPGFISFPSSIR
ncbi:unnamed protein product [Rhizophagus irregularis]|uniref:Uncharacterized protein n=1 Tax=Rhizophagus irregularis TaxID=588596 RepID=A0A916EID5_9GLOM|nr:unnamed protein product [Rhizophagus irregularis]GET52126.1 hypothetical protein RIR_jg30143.t1 [Rhizophagus irregularis DAOM 181602=DAOM 197198]CAB4417432.1 unnamed protein product [Rhizophagus irregularis]CAB4492324.1 unnamed protein product [Rhizophagus irregularis]CAB5358700.1 unnamed protein product [Rhizophagus irregularis]